MAAARPTRLQRASHYRKSAARPLIIEHVMSFSKRFGYSQRPEVELIRENAPESVRVGFLTIFEERLGARALRDIVCKVLRKRPDPNNWGEYPNIWNEVQDLVHDAQGFKVYDLFEAAFGEYIGLLPGNDSADTLSSQSYENVNALAAEINELFSDERLAWRMVTGKIVQHSNDDSDAIRARALQTLDTAGRQAAHHELREAINALSRRPQPDARDAVRRALGAMESAARDITGDRTATLGGILKRRPNLLPPPLSDAFSKVWGYSSDVARHVDETRAPTLKEAELVVGLVAAVITFLG